MILHFRDQNVSLEKKSLGPSDYSNSGVFSAVEIRKWIDQVAVGQAMMTGEAIMPKCIDQVAVD